MKTKIKNKDNKRKEMYDDNSKENGGFEAQPINWKKVIIIITVLVSIITGVVLIWLFALKGKVYLDGKKEAKELYYDVAVQPDSKAVAKLHFANDKLKASAVKMAEEIQKIYHNDGGFDLTSIDPKKPKIENYKYKDRGRTEAMTFSPTDYMFGFLDDSIKAYTDPKSPFVKYLTSKLLVRMKDEKITAIGFVGTANPAGELYSYLDGSYSKGMESGH